MTATAASDVGMNGLSVRIPKATQRYVLHVKVLDGIHHENLKELRNEMNDPITAIAAGNTQLIIQYAIIGAMLLTIAVLSRKRMAWINQSKWRPM